MSVTRLDLGLGVFHAHGARSSDLGRVDVDGGWHLATGDVDGPHDLAVRQPPVVQHRRVAPDRLGVLDKA